MKKLIRIIFLLLLVKCIFTAKCGDIEDTDCTGDTSDGYICISKSEGESGCEEVESCSLTTGAGLTDDICKTISVYNDKKEKMEYYTCVATSGGTGCQEKALECPDGQEPGSGLVCSGYSVAGKTVCSEEGGKCKLEIFCDSVEKTGTETIDCSSHPVTDPKNYACVENSEGDTPCKEELKPAPTTILKETQPLTEIATTIPKAIELSEVVSTIISTTIAKEIQTSKTETNQTTIPTTTIQESNTETSIVFLGCSKLNMAPSFFTFIIHFIPVVNSLFSDTLTFPLNIVYNTYLRRLEEVNANCNKGESNSKMVNYDCRVEAETANIKQIKFEPEFTFSQGSVKIAGSTPLAKMSMNNLKETDKYSELLSSNPSIYILDNSSFYGYANYKFNISGTISGTKPSSISENSDLSLMMNIQNSENEEEITKEADCTVTSINNDKYTLDCTAKGKNLYSLQSAMSIIDDNEILLVNINNSGNDDDGTVLNPSKEDDVQNVKYFSKKSGGIGAGAIVGIVLACAAALAAVITTILCLKKSPNSTTSNDSDMVNIRNINM